MNMAPHIVVEKNYPRFRDDYTFQAEVLTEEEWSELPQKGPQGLFRLLDVIDALGTSVRTQRHNAARTLASWVHVHRSDIPQLTKKLDQPLVFLRHFVDQQCPFWERCMGINNISNDRQYFLQRKVYLILQTFSEQEATLAAWCLLRALMLRQELSPYRGHSLQSQQVQHLWNKLLTWAENNPETTSLTDKEVHVLVQSWLDGLEPPDFQEHELRQQQAQVDTTWDTMVQTHGPLARRGKKIAQRTEPKPIQSDAIWQQIQEEKEAEQEKTLRRGRSFLIRDRSTLSRERERVDVEKKQHPQPQASAPPAPQKLPGDRPPQEQEPIPGAGKQRKKKRDQVPEERTRRERRKEERRQDDGRRRPEKPPTPSADEDSWKPYPLDEAPPPGPFTEGSMLDLSHSDSEYTEDTLYADDGTEIDLSEFEMSSPEASYEPAMMEAPQKRSSGLGTWLRVLFSPLLVPFWLVVGLGRVMVLTWTTLFTTLQALWQGLGNFVRDRWWEWKQKAEEEGIRLFELFLSEEAGRPGLVERLVAQSKLLLRAIQHTIGVRFVLWVNAVDALVDTTLGYLAGIFEAWKTLLTVKRKITHRNQAIHALANDVAMGRLKLSRLFSFVGFYPEEATFAGFPEDKDWEPALGRTFALKLILDTRNKLDDMKRDLSLLTRQQAVESGKRSITQFLASWIPNPLHLLTVWKDLALMVLFMRYSRREVEQMYVDLLDHYHNTMLLLQEQILQQNPEALPQPLQRYQVQLLEHETNMYTRIQRHRWEVTQLEATIERNRKHVQRLLQLLCHPVHPMDPKKWQRMDLVLENLKARQVGCMHPGMALAMEEWLAHEVRTHLKARSYRPSQQESTLVQREKQQRRQRAALLRKLQNDWGPML